MQWCSDLDLPASQGSIWTHLRVRACSDPALLQGELALQRCAVQEGGLNKPRVVQHPLPVLKLPQRGRARHQTFTT